MSMRAHPPPSGTLPPAFSGLRFGEGEDEILVARFAMTKSRADHRVLRNPAAVVDHVCIGCARDQTSRVWLDLRPTWRLQRRQAGVIEQQLTAVAILRKEVSRPGEERGDRIGVVVA